MVELPGHKQILVHMLFDIHFELLDLYRDTEIEAGAVAVAAVAQQRPFVEAEAEQELLSDSSSPGFHMLDN